MIVGLHSPGPADERKEEGAIKQDHADTSLVVRFHSCCVRISIYDLAANFKLIAGDPIKGRFLQKITKGCTRSVRMKLRYRLFASVKSSVKPRDQLPGIFSGIVTHLPPCDVRIGSSSIMNWVLPSAPIILTPVAL